MEASSTPTPTPPAQQQPAPAPAPAPVATPAPAPVAPAPELSPEVQARVDAGYYCPGCGKPAKYMKECTGSDTAPHPAIEVVPSAELLGDPSEHTPAPAGNVAAG